MATKKTKPKSKAKTPAPRRAATKRTAAPQRQATARGGTAIAGNVSTAADFVGRDQVTTTYNYAPAGLEKLVQKLLAFLDGGAVFVPHGTQRDGYRAELDGESLTFRPGALQQLTSGRRRSERTHLISLTVQRYSRWATDFVPLGALADLRQGDMDLPQTYELTEPPPANSGPEAQPRREALTDITEALTRHAAFVILGAPGAGKTTTLQKLAFEQARRVLGEQPGRVPLLVLLSQQHGKTPFEFLEAEWREATGTKIEFADALGDGRVLVLADGINELPRDPDERAARLKDWRVLVERYGDRNQFVFTSRASGEYAGQLNLPNVFVQPLDDDRIADYLHRQNAQGLAPFLADPRRRLQDLASNPFYLWMMTRVYRKDPTQLANRGRLIEQFVKLLLDREKLQAHRGWDQVAPVLGPALAHLAFAWQEQKLSLTIEARTARPLMPATVTVDDEECEVSAKDVFRLAQAATLLDPALKKTSLRFYHQLLQEYFAALELLRRLEAGEDLGRLWIAKRLQAEMPPAAVGDWDPLPDPPGTGWEETTILACGRAPDARRWWTPCAWSTPTWPRAAGWRPVWSGPRRCRRRTSPRCNRIYWSSYTTRPFTCARACRRVTPWAAWLTHAWRPR